MHHGMGGMGCPICNAMMQHHMGGHGMGMRGMMGGKGMMGMVMKPWKMMMIADELGLSDDQKQKLRDMWIGMRKQKVQTHCEIKLRKIDLMDMLLREQVNMADVEKQIRDMMNLKADMKIAMIRTMQDMKNTLTPDQRNKMKSMMMSWRKKGGWSGMGEESMEEEEGEEEGEESEGEE